MGAFISRSAGGIAAAVVLGGFVACGGSVSLETGDSGTADVAPVDAEASDAGGVDAMAADTGRADATTGDAASDAASDAKDAEASPGDASMTGDAAADAGADAAADAGADAAAEVDAGAGASGCAAACPSGAGCLGGSCQPTSSSNWRTFQYDESHAGYSPTEPGVPPMVGSWTRMVSDAGAPLHPAAAENGTIFVTSDTNLNTGGTLVALSAQDGSVLYTHDFGSVSSTGHPSVVNGTVYVQTNKGLNAGDVSHVWALDATTGNVRWSSPFDSQWEHFWAPTVAGGMVYVDGGRFGGLYAFDISNGNQVFFSDTIGQYDSWTPTYAGGVLYTWVAGGLVARDPATGALLWNNGLPWSDATPYSVNAAAAFDSTGGYVISPPLLAAVDPVAQDFRWTLSASYTGTPAVANGVVYAVSGGELVANDAGTGAALWTFAGDGKLSYPPIVANGFVYVSSTANVFAVDVRTHTEAWTDASGGWLAVTSGRLVVAGADGIARAFVLTLR